VFKSVFALKNRPASPNFRSKIRTLSVFSENERRKRLNLWANAIRPYIWPQFSRPNAKVENNITSESSSSRFFFCYRNSTLDVFPKSGKWNHLTTTTLRALRNFFSSFWKPNSFSLCLGVVVLKRLSSLRSLRLCGEYRLESAFAFICDERAENGKAMADRSRLTCPPTRPPKPWRRWKFQRRRKPLAHYPRFGVRELF